LDANQWKDAKWAYEKGLFTKTYPSIKELDNALLEKAEKYSNYSLKSLENIKKILWKNTSHWNGLLKKRAQISGKMLLNKETKELIQKVKK